MGLGVVKGNKRKILVVNHVNGCVGSNYRPQKAICVLASLLKDNKPQSLYKEIMSFVNFP